MNQRDRLIELIINTPHTHNVYVNPRYCGKTIQTAENIADHLIANGVIVPPCKVGDVLYVISQMKDKRILPFVNEYEATHIQVGKRKCKVYHEKDGYIKIFLQDDFGKTVFLSREDAERALKRKEQK